MNIQNKLAIIFLVGILIMPISLSQVSETQELRYNSIKGYFDAPFNIVIGNSTNNITLDFLQGKIIIDGSPMGGSSNESSQTFGTTSGNVTVNATGFSYAGDARQVKMLQEWAYDITGNTGTYNGISCGSSGLAVLNRISYFRSFDDGGGGGTCETAIWNVLLPEDYDPGTNVTFEIPWTASADTGNVVWEAGLLATSIGQIFGEAETYAPSQTLAVGATAGFDRNTNIVWEFDGTGFSAGDALSFVTLRDADNANDTATGDTQINLFTMNYVSIRNGIPIEDSELSGNTIGVPKQTFNQPIIPQPTGIIQQIQQIMIDVIRDKIGVEIIG